MRLNENTAVSTSKLLLVPYDPRHVPRYYVWMTDPAIQEATASEPLTLEEEYENQKSWRASHDKLTFILCQPLSSSSESSETSCLASIKAGEADAPGRMIGDINFFLYFDEEEEEAASFTSALSLSPSIEKFVGEIDVMIADENHRGKGLGKTALSAFTYYILRNINDILAERHGYQVAQEGAPAENGTAQLKMLMAKIKKENEASLALFRSLGFVQEGEVNYFGEVKLVLRDFARLSSTPPEGYREILYSRE